MAHRPWRDIQIADGPAICTSVTEEEAAELGRLAAGKCVLEVGTAHGYSAVAMALAGATQVVSVDSQPDDRRQIAQSRVDAYGVGHIVTLVTGASPQALIGMPREYFDLAFIDGWHEEQAVFDDMAAAMPLLKPSGTIAFHDYDEDCCCPGVKTVLDLAYPQGPSGLTGTLFVVDLESLP